MRETLGSMRAYFILVSLVSGAQTLFALSGSEHLLASIVLCIGLVVAVAYLGVGVALRPILRRGVVPITIFLAAGLGWIAFSFLIGLLFGQLQVVGLVVGLAINLYLLKNGRRLARELKPAAISNPPLDQQAV